MIIELTKYVEQEKLTLVVSEIVSVEFEHKTDNSNSSLDKDQYEVIIETNKRTHKLWYNGRKEIALATYDKVKNALLEIYKKDTIESEIKKYLENLENLK